MIDETSGDTSFRATEGASLRRSANVVWHPGAVGRGQRPSLGATVWFTGLSGSGKSTVAAACERLLVESGRSAYLLDGDNVRHGLNGDLGFSAGDRKENVRRIGEVALLLADAGVIVLVPVISPYAADRTSVRDRHQSASIPFIEVYVATPIEVCEARDPKGLYRQARAGTLTGFTGIDDPYEAPTRPEVTIETSDGPVEDQAVAVLEAIRDI